jgi:hypothetical protein
MSLLYLLCHIKGEKMYRDDYDYVKESVAEQLLLILWTSFVTLAGVGVILWIAL